MDRVVNESQTWATAFSSGFSLVSSQPRPGVADKIGYYHYLPTPRNATGTYDVVVDERQHVARFAIRQIACNRNWAAEEVGRGRFAFVVHLYGRRSVSAPGYCNVTLSTPRLAVYWQTPRFKKVVTWRRDDREMMVSFDGNPRLIENLVQLQPQSYPREFVDIVNGKQRDFWWMDVALSSGLAVAARAMLDPIISGSLSSVYYRAKNLELLALALRNMQCASAIDDHAVKVSPRVRRIVDRVRDELDHEMSEPKCVSDLARSHGIGTTALCIAFKSIYQCTIREYSRMQRLERARQLLLKSNLDVKEIAWRVGYAHTSNFALAVKEYFGLTPRQIRLGN